MMPVIFSSPAPSKERSHWKALTQALHINFLAGKRHFLLLRYCLHCHDQAAVSLNSWQESSKVLSAVQTHRPGVHPSRLSRPRSTSRKSTQGITPAIHHHPLQSCRTTCCSLPAGSRANTQQESAVSNATVNRA